MGIILKKEKFTSKMPEKYQKLTIDDMTNELMYQIMKEFPEITTPKYIDKELEKGHISKEKADELKRKSIISGIDHYVKKEKELHDNKSKSVLDKFKSDASRKTRSMVAAYESECSGVISKDELFYLINALQ